MTKVQEREDANLPMRQLLLSLPRPLKVRSVGSFLGHKWSTFLKHLTLRVAHYYANFAISILWIWQFWMMSSRFFYKNSVKSMILPCKLIDLTKYFSSFLCSSTKSWAVWQKFRQIKFLLKSYTVLYIDFTKNSLNVEICEIITLCTSVAIITLPCSNVTPYRVLEIDLRKVNFMGKIVNVISAL